ncbi:MAG: Gfo/Idh/MocA family oxidoreductase, partial [Clostridia bacterium]|nr:Gfo/Idh/MocA family oxidoreductase [Clostridia bacterium]
MKKVKWGVIGAGGIADRRTIPGMMLANNAELVAVMEINMELAEKIRAKYGCKYAYDNYQELIDNPEVEAIYIASPVFAHVEPALAVAKAKKHLLCEKPIAFTVEETKNIINACKEAGVKYATGYMMRFGAYHMAIKKLIAEGGIGNVVSARAQLSGWFPESAKNWRQEKKLSGGGALVDMAVHCIDIIEYLTGA